ncbi:ATP-binding protein [Nocardioides sp. GXQ0305]|uniref:ATP-binding protein n=1 Tax=Nocardioides sp. GXQ0305 TaxID=3423912 RepID=UPI003D7D4FBD
MGGTGELVRPSMHGRGGPLDAAARRVAAVGDGEGQLLLVTGEAGIGKTRFLQALRDLATEQGFVTWSAAAFPEDVEFSAGLLLDLGHSLARSDRAEISVLGRDLVDGLEAVPPPAAGSGDAHRRRRLLVLDAVDRLTRLTDEGPVLLALEDLHWCDELSLDVITHLARRVRSRPLLVVGTVRTDELLPDLPVRAWRSRLLLQRMAEEVPLSRLSGSETTRMVAEMLPAQDASPALVELVQRRSGGVPLHVEELVKALVHGHLSADPSYVPETLAEAVDQRFGMLSAPAQEVGVTAAVVRRSFDLDVIASLAQQPEPDVAHAFDELVERQFLQQEPGGWYGFRHALIRDAVERAAPLATRRTLHARVAELARRRPELGGDGYRSVHHEAAGQLPEASAAAGSAAERASALSAHHEALELLDRAIRCLRDDDPSRLVPLLERRAAEAAATDHNARAAEDYERARAAHLAQGDRVAAAALLPPLVAARHLLGDPLPVRVALLDAGIADLAEPVDDAADDARREQVRAALLAAKAAAYLVDDRLDESITAGEAALALDGDLEEQVRLNTAATLGCVLVFAGRMDEGWDRLERAAREARELRLEWETARAYRMLGSAASTLVEYDRAEYWLAEGIDYAARTEQANHRSYMTSHQAHVAWCRGRWDEADELARQGLTDELGGITTRIVAQHVTGFVALGRGDLAGAAAVLEEARVAGTEMGELQRFSPALWGLAECRLLAGDAQQAVELSEAGYQASHEVADAANLFPFLVTGTRARLALPDPAAAQDWADRVGADLEARGVPGTLPALDHAAGLLHLAAGRTGKARERLSAAHEAWTARGRWWEGQWCALDLARCALASNRRTEASGLVEAVRAAAQGQAATVLLDACEQVASRLDEHDAVPAWAPLTLREFEVAKLVARGLTNREIAEELRVTVRTAGSHLEHIGAKLGTSRRTEIATWVASLDRPT